MQAKIFLSSLLASLPAVGVIATPTGIEARSAEPQVDLSTIATELANVVTDIGSAIGAIGAIGIPIEAPTIPIAGEVLTALGGVGARDLVRSELSFVN